MFAVRSPFIAAHKSQERPVQAQVDDRASAVTPEDQEARRRAADAILKSFGFKGGDND